MCRVQQAFNLLRRLGVLPKPTLIEFESQSSTLDRRLEFTGTKPVGKVGAFPRIQRLSLPSISRALCQLLSLGATHFNFPATADKMSWSFSDGIRKTMCCNPVSPRRDSSRGWTPFGALAARLPCLLNPLRSSLSVVLLSCPSDLTTPTGTTSNMHGWKWFDDVSMPQWGVADLWIGVGTLFLFDVVVFPWRGLT